VWSFLPFVDVEDLAHLLSLPPPQRKTEYLASKPSVSEVRFLMVIQ
jgi:hypothetical protein